MNIIEARKSGKRYKRRGYTTWYDPTYSLGHFVVDILADDWEVEGEVFQVTEEELREIISDADAQLYESGINKLGLKYNMCSEDLILLKSKIIELLRDRNE